MVGSWRPPITEVHGLAPHGQAVRSVSVFRGPCSVIREERRTEDGGNTEKPIPSSEDGQKKNEVDASVLLHEACVPVGFALY